MTNSVVNFLLPCEKIIKIDTYKHWWFVGSESGNAYSVWKEDYWLQWYPYMPFKRNLRVIKNNASIYDYFVSDNFVDHSKHEAKIFIQDIIVKHNLRLQNRKVLDISGGNGVVAKTLQEDFGSNVTLTEFNAKAVEFARSKLGIAAVKYDFQKDNIADLLKGSSFDIVLMRAAIMFCLNIEEYLKQLKKILNKNSLVVVQYLTKPTLGTMLVTQFDDYNYLALYQPEYVISVFEKRGFSLVVREDESDLNPYVYECDKTYKMTMMRILYETKAIKKLPFESKFLFRARDRKRSNLIFQLND